MIIRVKKKDCRLEKKNHDNKFLILETRLDFCNTQTRTCETNSSKLEKLQTVSNIHLCTTDG